MDTSNAGAIRGRRFVSVKVWIVKYDPDIGKLLGDERLRFSSLFYMTASIQKPNRKWSMAEYFNNYTSESYAYNIAIKNVLYNKQRAAGYHVRTAQLIINYQLQIN